MEMKNSDKPIYPIVDEAGYCALIDSLEQQNKPIAIGLTKREYFAGLAMQGFMASCNHFPDLKHFEGTAKMAAEMSLKMADELLKQLER